MRFSNILLVLGNHSHRVSAFRRAAEFARNAGADLTVCEVVAWADSDYSGYLTEATSRKLLDKIVAERTMRLQQMIDSCDIGDLRTAAKVLVGKPRFEIAHSVRANHYDLVIKTFESRRGIRHLADRREIWSEIVRALCGCSMLLSPKEEVAYWRRWICQPVVPKATNLTVTFLRCPERSPLLRAGHYI